MSDVQSSTSESQIAAQPQEGATQHDTDSLPEWAREKLTKANNEAAKYRTQAKANADAAKRLAEIEEANKTEAEKLSDALAAAEKEREDARAEALRLRVATKFGISDEDADLFLTATDEETLTKQAERLSARESERKKHGNHVRREGANPTPGNGELSDFTRVLFRRNS